MGQFQTPVRVHGQSARQTMKENEAMNGFQIGIKKILKQISAIRESPCKFSFDSCRRKNVFIETDTLQNIWVRLEVEIPLTSNENSAAVATDFRIIPNIRRHCVLF